VIHQIIQIPFNYLNNNNLTAPLTDSHLGWPIVQVQEVQ